MAQAMTKFTRKQAGVIFAASKRGDIEIDKNTISYMYDLTEGGIDWNGSLNSDIQDFKAAVDAIFANDYKKAQKRINEIAA